MVNYYNTHLEDFNNAQHNLKNINIKEYIRRPKIYGAHGIIYYLSNKSCKILVNHMEKINYNIFTLDLFTNSYPYTIEDCAVSFILYMNDIPFIHNDIFFDSTIAIAKHTNDYK